jgi:integrase
MKSLQQYQHYLKIEQKQSQIPSRIPVINNFLEFTHKKKIDEKILAKYREYLLTKVSDKTLQKSSARTYVMYVRSFLRWQKIEIPIDFKITGVTRKIGNYLSRKKIEALERDMKFAGFDITDRTIIRILLLSGLRLSELINLKIADVDLDELTLKVLGKGNKERLVTMPDILLKYLKTYLAYRKSPDLRRHVLNKDRKILLVKTWKNKYKLRKVYTRYVQRLVKELTGEEDVTPHTLRRTYGTWLLYGGVPLPDVSKNLGHSSPTTTLTYYTKPTKEGDLLINKTMKGLYRHRGKT